MENVKKEFGVKVTYRIGPCAWFQQFFGSWEDESEAEKLMKKIKAGDDGVLTIEDVPIHRSEVVPVYIGEDGKEYVEATIEKPYMGL